MLISGVLYTVFAAVTWMFRRRENIHRIFSFFTRALALDSFAFTGYDKRLADKFLWIRVGHFRKVAILYIVSLMFLSLFTGLHHEQVGLHGYSSCPWSILTRLIS